MRIQAHDARWPTRNAGGSARGGGRVSVDEKRNDQLPRGREPAAAAEIPLGVGEISRRLQQSLDADRGLHAGRHRAVEIARRADARTSAARSSAISASSPPPKPGRQQHRAGDLPPPHATRNAGSICCARLSRRRSTPTPSSTSSRASAWTKARCSTCIARCPRSPPRRPGR